MNYAALSAESVEYTDNKSMRTQLISILIKEEFF